MKILAATDLSARSDRALERAVALTRQHDARLTILHVVDENLPDAVLETVIKAAEAEIESSLAKLVQREDAPVTIWVVAGNGYREIVEAAEREACDLIVLGRHRNESSEAAHGGTTMGRIIRTGSLPVLVVTDRADHPYRTVMVGVDFSETSRDAVRAALEIVGAEEIHLVHAFDVPFEGFLPGEGTRREVAEERDRDLSRLAEEELGPRDDRASSGPGGTRVRIHTALRQGEVRSVLRREAARIDPDVLVIGTHGRTGVARAILGSVAQDLVDRPPCDVLAVKRTGDGTS